MKGCFMDSPQRTSWRDLLSLSSWMARADIDALRRNENDAVAGHYYFYNCSYAYYLRLRSSLSLFIERTKGDYSITKTNKPTIDTYTIDPPTQ